MKLSTRAGAAAILIGSSLTLTAGPAHAGSGDGVGVPQGPPGCPAKNVFSFINTSVKSDRIGRVGPPQSNYYGAAGTMRLTAGFTGTVGASVSTTVEAEASLAMFAKVKASVNGTVSTSVSVSLSNETSFSVPAKHYGNSVYGRYRVVVTGTSRKQAATTCAITDKKVTYYVSGTNRPTGWCSWTSTASLGSRPAQCNDGSPYVP